MNGRVCRPKYKILLWWHQRLDLVDLLWFSGVVKWFAGIFEHRTCDSPFEQMKSCLLIEWPHELRVRQSITCVYIYLKFFFLYFLYRPVLGSKNWISFSNCPRLHARFSIPCENVRGRTGSDVNLLDCYHLF